MVRVKGASKLKRICLYCKKEFRTYPSEISRGYGKYCSLRCAKLMDNNPLWKGEEVGYGALHDWVIRKKPIPDSCEICGLHKEKVPRSLEAANISGEYKRNVNDYVYLCPKCHKGTNGFDETKRKNPQIEPIIILNQMKLQMKSQCKLWEVLENGK